MQKFNISAIKTATAYMLNRYMRFYILIFILLFVISCKKTDEIYPVIKITYPTANLSFSTIDTIHIKGKITDNDKIVSYSFSIVGSKMNIVSQTVTKSGQDSKSIILNDDFFYSNIYLPSGQYYLLTSASDGTNKKNSYTKISLQAINTELKSIIVSLDNNGTTDICKLDSGKLKLLFNCQENYQDIDVNSDYGQIMILSKNGKLKSYDAYTYNLKWEKTNLNDYYSEYFSRIKNFDKITYVGYNFGSIKSINKYGTITNTYNLNSNIFLPSDIFKFNNEICSYFFSKNTQQGEIAYFYETGGLHNYYSINIDKLIGIFDYDKSNIFIIGNIGDSAKAYTLNTENNYLYNEKKFVSAKIISAFKNNDNIYYSTQTDIKRYNITDNAIYNFIDNINNAKLFYDKLNQYIYVSSNNKIFLYNKNGDLINTYNTNNSVLDIDFLYNKSL